MLLTIDIGTSTFKYAVWNYDGKRIFFSFVPLSFISDGIKCEIQPKEWLDVFKNCCQKAGNLSGVDVIIISGNGPTLVPVEKDETLQVKARLWMDRRAEKYQERVSEVMNGFVDASFFLPKVLYIKNEEENLYNNTISFIGCPEYLAYKLTGELKTVFPSEGFERWFWNDKTLDRLNLDKDKFPVFINPGDRFGVITPPAAESYGFKKDIPVIAGGPDFYSAILGSGVTEPGTACNRTGTSDGINLCTRDYVKHDFLMSYKHPVKPFWNLSGIIKETGKIIENSCVKNGIKSFDEYFKKAEKDESLKNVLEQIGFKIKDIINLMEGTGEYINKLCVTGGLADCTIFNQIKADITGKPVIESIYREAELLGLFIIGACSLGRFSSSKEASSHLYKIKRCFEPDKNKNDLYNQLYLEYKESRKDK